MPTAILRSALALALLTSLAPPLAAQAADEETRPLSGSVVDASTGAPVSGALVELVGRKRGVFTDELGRFTLREVERGAHAVLVVQLGYDSLHAQVARDGEVLRLRPDPVVLEGIRVVSDRLQRRRNAVATSVHAYDRSMLQTSGSRDALDFIRTHTMLSPIRCPGGLTLNSCAYVRGRPTPVVVYIDDVPVYAGLEFLDTYRPEELYLVEVFRGGSHIRVYTNWFMEHSARTGRRPTPVLMW